MSNSSHVHAIELASGEFKVIEVIYQLLPLHANRARPALCLSTFEHCCYLASIL